MAGVVLGPWVYWLIALKLIPNLRQRQENAARAVERDRLHWESVQKTWHASTEADKAHLEMKHKVNNWLQLFVLVCGFSY